MAKDEKAINFEIAFEPTDIKIHCLPTDIFFEAHLLSRNGTILQSASVQEGKFSFNISHKELKASRLVLAPVNPQSYKEKETFSKAVKMLDKRLTYEPVLPELAEKIILPDIPVSIWKYWCYCTCRVRGRVFNYCHGTYQPVYYAKVHVCEVDPIWLWLKRLPDDAILRIKDSLLHPEIIEKPPHVPIGPGPIEFAMEREMTNENMKMMMTGLKSKMAKDSRITLSDTTASAKDTSSASATLPPHNISVLHTESVHLIREYLVDNYQVLYPWWCYWIPIYRWWWYACDEITTFITNEQGWFDRNIYYNCFGDRPDLYFWVEYNINGVWTTVYNPPIHCNTYWNYTCGTEVDIYLHDQRIPCPIPQPNIGDKDVFVFSIGNNVSVTKVYQDGTMKGQTMTGTPYEEGSPFGGSIEPRVYFGSALCDAVDGGNNYFYKWSFRKEGDLSWKEIITDTFRHYLQETADGPIFPVYRFGANLDKLYQILRYHLPVAAGGNDLWVVDSRTDTASTKWVTTDMDVNGIADDFSTSDGVYEIKMELYKYVAGVAERVNWTAEGINLYIPLNTLSSPFGDVTIDHETNAGIINSYKYTEAGVLYGFIMKIFIDNKAPNLSLEDVSVTNADATTGVAGPCGFIAFKNRNTSTINFKFNASQQNNFAGFGFVILKGNGSTDTFSAGNRVGVATTPLLHNGLNSGNNVNLVAGDYELHVSPDFLLGSCNKAAFLQSVSIHPLVQDGYSRLYNDWSLSTAFALEHHNGD